MQNEDQYVGFVAQQAAEIFGYMNSGTANPLCAHQTILRPKDQLTCALTWAISAKATDKHYFWSLAYMGWR